MRLSSFKLAILFPIIPLLLILGIVIAACCCAMWWMPFATARLTFLLIVCIGSSSRSCKTVSSPWAMRPFAMVPFGIRPFDKECPFGILPFAIWALLVISLCAILSLKYCMCSFTTFLKSSCTCVVSVSPSTYKE